MSKIKRPTETEVMLLRNKFQRESLSADPKWKKRFDELIAERWHVPAKMPYISPYSIHG